MLSGYRFFFCQTFCFIECLQDRTCLSSWHNFGALRCTLRHKWQIDCMFIVSDKGFLQHKSPLPIHRLMAGGFSTKCQPAQQELTHTHSHTDEWEQNGVQYLSHRYFDIQTGGMGDRTTNLLISQQPALPLATVHFWNNEPWLQKKQNR